MSEQIRQIDLPKLAWNLGLIALAGIGVCALSFNAITHCGKTYHAGEESEPIKKLTNEGWGTITTTQTLLGRFRGGVVRTLREVNFIHHPEKSSCRRTRQSLRVGKEITLLDGSKARGS